MVYSVTSAQQVINSFKVLYLYESLFFPFNTSCFFQTYKENAPECFTIVHYPDLIDEKGVVLMKGDYDKNVLVSCLFTCCL